MTNHNLNTSIKMSSDIELYKTSLIQISEKSKIQQDKQKSTTNLTAILSLLDVQICLEENSEILAILIDQKTNLNEILIQKQSDKKNSFKTVEKEAISQLQNQVSSLERTVDKKFETILESIKNSQSIANSWAQIAAQNNQKEQEQQKVLTEKKMSQKQIEKQAKKQAQIQNQNDYEAKRLILHVKAEMWKDFNSYNLRNQINDAFLQKENIANPVIASVTRSRAGFSIVLTTMSEYNADFLLEKQQIWEEIFSQNIKSVEKNTKWHKIVVHEMPILSFSASDDLSILRNEIETFNSDLKLLRDSNWLSSEENKQEKRHASIVFAVDNAEQAQKAIKKKLYITEVQLVAESYKSSETKTQYQKCQRLEHSTRHCINQEYCQICAEKHYTKHHKCHICQIVEIECSHSKLKCRNCGENHKSNSQICSIWGKQVSLSISPAKSDVAMENSADFAVVIPHVRW